MACSTGAVLFLCFHAVFCFSGISGVAQVPSVAAAAGRPAIVEWTALSVEHAYGLPEVKAHKKGSLTVSSAGVDFKSKSGTYNIPAAALVAVSAGDERVEMWGTKGRVLRMVIPDGGGLAAAGFMHHKVNMLSVEFKDKRHGYHAAVFYTSAAEAQHVLASFVDLPVVARPSAAAHAEAAEQTCQGQPFVPHSVLLMMPNWNEATAGQAEVPSAYKALLYEHAINRLERIKGIGHVYREDEAGAVNGCPEYTIQVSVSAFKQGSQVKRAVMGPVGLFVGTTQLKFDITISDATKRMNATEHLKTTVRGENESKTVADSVAKSIAKHYVSETKTFEKAISVGPAKA